MLCCLKKKVRKTAVSPDKKFKEDKIGGGLALE